MRTLLAGLTLACGLVWGAPAHVGGNSAQSFATATTIAVTYTATTGNLLAIHTCNSVNTDTLSSVSDGTNTYTRVDTAIRSGAGTSCGTAYAKNITGGSLTITATWGTSTTHRYIAVDEVSGVDTTAPLDQHATNNQAAPGTGTDAVTVGPVTTTANGEYIWAGDGDMDAQNTINAGTNFTGDQSIGGLRTEHLTSNQTSAGSISATFTDTGAFQSNGTAMMTFKAAGGATHGLFQGSLLNGVTTGGPFFANPVSFRPLAWVLPVWLWRKRVVLRRLHALRHWTAGTVFVRSRVADPAFARPRIGGASVRAAGFLAASAERPDCPVRSIHG